MSDDVRLSAFPDGAEEAIAMLYLQQQDLSGKSPSDLYLMFQETYYEIKKCRKKLLNEGWFHQKKEELRQP